MRDLLTHLVRRTLRPELTVQPRLPSRYEPRTDAEVTATVTPTAVGRARSPNAPSSEQGRSRSRLDDVRPDRAARFPNAADRAAREGDNESVAATQPPVWHDIPVRTPSRDAGGVSTPPPAGVRASAPATLPRPVVAAQARDAERTIAPVSTIASQGRGDTDGAEPTFARSTVPAVTGPARADAMERSARLAAAIDGAPGSADETPAPEIRISIGRIEVRATVADGGGARRPERAAHPTQSLNDYLDARARGGRR